MSDCQAHRIVELLQFFARRRKVSSSVWMMTSRDSRASDRCSHPGRWYGRLAVRGVSDSRAVLNFLRSRSGA
jgi:hypothetical protein